MAQHSSTRRGRRHHRHPRPNAARVEAIDLIEVVGRGLRRADCVDLMAGSQSWKSRYSICHQFECLPSQRRVCPIGSGGSFLILSRLADSRLCSQQAWMSPRTSRHRATSSGAQPERVRSPRSADRIAQRARLRGRASDCVTRSPRRRPRLGGFYLSWTPRREDPHSPEPMITCRIAPRPPSSSPPRGHRSERLPALHHRRTP